MEIKKDILWRVALVYISLLVFGLCIVARVVWLQFVEVAQLSKKANQLSLKDIEIEPSRGNILACDGKLLATSVPYYEIRLDLSPATIDQRIFNQNIDSLSICLSKLFKDKSAELYKRELTRARKQNQRYYLLKRKIDFTELKRMRYFPIFRLGKFKGGFIVIQHDTRFQPYGNMAARTIGYLSRSDENIMVGIEGSFNESLKGQKGIRLMQRIPGNVWMPVYDENEIEPQDGYDIVTTIDVNLQDVATYALEKQLKQQNAHHGTAVLMEVETGDIKAIANLERDENGSYREYYNYAIGESTEPGSTIKLASLMAAMEDGYITLDDTVDTGNGSLKIYDLEIKDHDQEHGGFGPISIQQVLENSSNVGIVSVVMKYYQENPKRFVDHLYQFGLNKKLNLQIKGEGTPEIKYPGTKYWSGVSLAQMSYGYELRLTPIQILTFYNAIANDGKMVKPRFVSEIQFRGQTISSFEPEVIKSSIASHSTLKKARIMLEGVVEKGTATNLKNLDYKIAGKTGTAQIAKGNKGYRQDAYVSYQASFVGYFPAENPKYSCIVIINSPSNGVYYGNIVAGSVFKEIADKVYSTSFNLHQATISGKKNQQHTAPYLKHGYRGHILSVLDELGINYEQKNDKKTDWVNIRHDSAQIKISNRKIINSLIPDVTGMGIRDAVYLIEKSGMRAIFNGYGKVIRQSEKPGKMAMRNGSVVLTLSN